METVSSALGRDGEIRCSLCEQMMPVLGIDPEKGGLDGRCAHVLCSECLEESSQGSLTMQGQGQECPACVKWGAMPALTLSRGQAGNIGMRHAPDSGVSAGAGHKGYFNTAGYSTKVRKVVEDVAVDLGATKRYVHGRRFP